MRKKEILFVSIFFGILSIFLLKSLFTAKFYTSHDGDVYLARVAQYTIAIKDGQIPPRWGGNLHGNLGYPIFVYSYHLPFFLSSIFHIIGLSITSSVKLLYIFSYGLSAIGMYLFLRCKRDKISSFTGAMFYTLFPYRFVNIFVRSSIGESLSIALVPFILWSIKKLSQDNSSKWVSLSALWVFLAITSHTLFLTTFLPIILIYSLLFLKNKKSILIAVSIGILSSSFMLMPQIFERGYVQINEYFKNNSTEHLVTFKQLVHSPWDYGISHPGHVLDDMSFQVGLVHLLILAIFLGEFVLSKFFNKKASNILNKLKIFKSNNLKISTTQIFWAVIAITSMFVITDNNISVFLWSRFLKYTAVDFPWRILGVIGLAISTVAADILMQIKNRRAILVCIIFLLLYANRNHLRIAHPWDVSDQEIYSNHSTTTYKNEFRPIWRENLPIKTVTEAVFISDENETKNIIIGEKSSNKLTFTTNFNNPTQVNINTLYFPGWSIERYSLGKSYEMIKDKDFFIRKGGFYDHKDAEVDGTMYIDVPKGINTYKLFFKETPIRKAGNYLSILGLLIIIFLQLKTLKNK